MGRNPDGTWAQGTSGNPDGSSSDEMRKIKVVRRAVLNRTMKAVRTLDRLMDDENGKVAATAALGILKASGAFGDEEKIKAEVERRLKSLLEEAQNSAPPPKLTAVG